MINSIWIDNFKSLVDFELNFAKFNCLVGLNGSGKSTVLQALDFVSQLMQGDLEGWLTNRHWESTDLNSKLSKKSNIDFKIIFENKSWGEIIWSGSFNRKTLSCTQERVERDGILLLKVEEGHCFMAHSFVHNSSSDRFAIVFDYQGSILSQLKESQINPVLRDIKEFVLRIESLDMLSPELLRSRAKSSDGKLGLGGEKLSAFIHESGKQIWPAAFNWHWIAVVNGFCCPWHQHRTFQLYRRKSFRSFRLASSLIRWMRFIRR